MPAEPLEAAEWMMNKLLAATTSSKMFPVKLAHMKNQAALCVLATACQLLTLLRRGYEEACREPRGGVLCDQECSAAPLRR